MKHLTILIMLIWSSLVNAQFGPQQIITTEANGTYSIFVTDLDGDNLPDVVSANKHGYSVTWFKNLDGESFGPQLFIASLNQPTSIYSADIDGDNDMDILSLSTPDDLVVWYENLDGLGTFSEQRIIYSDDELPRTIIAADIDGDSDLDVVLGSGFLGLNWFENLDGNADFGPIRVINSAAPNARSVVASDIDGDNDLDIVSSSSGAVTLTWYENLDGMGNFGPLQVIAPNDWAVNSIFVIDLDNDDDNDVLATRVASDKLSWYENLDGLGAFGNEIIITTQADGAISVYASDLDNDSDNDVLLASGNDQKISWFENLDGMGNLGPRQIISIDNQLPFVVITEDVDNDGDQDVFSISPNEDKIAWYENLTILGVEENLVSKIEIHPNPASDYIYIENEPQIPILSLQIYDATGRLVLEKKSETHEIEISHLDSGLYFLNVETEEGKIAKKVIKH